VAADLAVDATEIIGAVEDARLNAADLHGGRYEGAHVTLFEVDWRAPGAGQKIHFEGPLGEVTTRGEEFVAEVRSWTAYLARNISQAIGPQCRKDFGSRVLADERKPNTPCGVDLDPPAWAAATAYTATVAGDRLVGSRVRPTSFTGWWFACTVAGTSGGSEPAWPTTLDATVVDGGVTWRAEPALAVPGTVTGVTDRLRFSASGIAIAAGFLARGWIEWLTGDNAAKGVRSPVAADDGAGALSLYRPAIAAVAIGDTFTAYRGCDRSQAACTGFSNWVNHNGFPHVPPKTV
jgi:hypothetical protein